MSANDKFIFAIDHLGNIVTRNPDTGGIAFIEVKAGQAPDNVVYHELGTFGNVPFTAYFFNNQAVPATDRTDVPLYEFGPDSETNNDVSDAATSGANGGDGDGVPVTLTLNTSGTNPSTGVGPKTAQLTDIDTVLPNWAGNTGPEGRYYHTGFHPPITGWLRVWDAHQQVAFENRAKSFGSGILGDWVEYSGGPHTTPQDNHMWHRNPTTNTDGVYWSQYCQQYFEIDWGNPTAAELSSNPLPEAGDAFEPEGGVGKYVIAAIQNISDAGNPYRYRYWFWNYGGNYAGAANLGTGLGSPSQTELGQFLAQSGGKVRFYKYSSVLGSGGGGYPSGQMHPTGIQHGTAVNVGNCQGLDNSSAKGTLVRVLKLFKAGNDEFGKGQIGATKIVGYDPSTLETAANKANFLINTETAVESGHQTMHPAHAATYGFHDDYSIKFGTGMYNGDAPDNGGGNKNEVFPIIKAFYGDGTSDDPGLFSGNHGTIEEFIDLDITNMGSAATQTADRRTFTGNDQIAYAVGVTAYDESKWLQKHSAQGAAKVTLGGLRTWGWAYTKRSNLPSAFSAGVQASGCKVSVEVSDFGGNTDIVARLFEADGTTRASNSLGQSMNDLNLSSSSHFGAFEFNNSDTIPDANPNQDYTVKFATGTTWNESNVIQTDNVTQDACKYYTINQTFTYQTGCNLTVALSDVTGFSASKIALVNGQYGEYPADVLLDANGNPQVLTATHNTVSGDNRASATFNLAGGNLCGGEVGIRVIDTTTDPENPDEFNIQTHSNHAFMVDEIKCLTISAFNSGNCGITFMVQGSWAGSAACEPVIRAKLCDGTSQIRQMSIAGDGSHTFTDLQPNTTYTVKFYKMEGITETYLGGTTASGQGESCSGGSSGTGSKHDVVITNLTGCVTGNVSLGRSGCSINASVSGTELSASQLRLKVLKNGGPPNNLFTQVGDLIIPSSNNGITNIVLGRGTSFTPGLKSGSGEYKVQLLDTNGNQIHESESITIPNTPIDQTGSCQYIQITDQQANACMLNVTVESLDIDPNDFLITAYKDNSRVFSDVPITQANGIINIDLSSSGKGTGNGSYQAQIIFNNNGNSYNIGVGSGTAVRADTPAYGADPNTANTAITGCSGVAMSTVSASGCGLSVTISSTGYGTNDLFFRVNHQGGAQIGTDTDFPVTNLNGANTITFPTGTCNGNYVVAVIDSNGTVLQDTGGVAVAVHNCPVTLGADSEIAGCSVTGKVDTVTCIPSRDDGKVEIKATLLRIASPSVEVETISIVKDNLAAWITATSNDNTVDYLFNTGIENGNYQINYSYVDSSGNDVSITGITAGSVTGCQSIVTSVAEGTGSEACGINITVTSATGLGSTIRAIVFKDVDGGGFVNSADGSAIQNAKNAAGQVLDFEPSPTGATLDFAVSSLPTTLYVDLNDVVDPNAMSNDTGQQHKYVVEYLASNDGGSTYTPLNGSPFNMSGTDDSVQVTQCTVCADNSEPHYFEVSGGKIITNNGSGTRAIKSCGSAADIVFKSGGYCLTAGSEMTVYRKSTSGEFTSSSEACNAGSADATQVTIRLRGSDLTSGRDLKAFEETTSGSGTFDSLLPDGYYLVCGTGTPNSDYNGCTPSSNEYFIYISTAAGDWDGKVYNANNTVAATWATASDWFYESQISGWSGQPSTGNGFTGGGTPEAAGAVGLCSDEYSDANTGNNILYVTGTVTNHRQDSDRLRIYRGDGSSNFITNPLPSGWYRFCGALTPPKVNGVPEYRENFNCYGNPFSWWSAKPVGSMILDSNNYLTNSVDYEFWYTDAPLKDLTDTNNDLGLKYFTKTGDTQESTIDRITINRDCSLRGWSGGASDPKFILNSDSSRKSYLSRQPLNDYHTGPSTGAPVISSSKTSATEITTALVFNTTASSGTLFKLTDIVDTSTGGTVTSWGDITKLASIGTPIVESTLTLSVSATNEILLQTSKRSITYDATTETASWGSADTSPDLKASVSAYSVVVIKATAEGHFIRVNGELLASNTTPSKFCDGNVGITNLNTEIAGQSNGTPATMTLSDCLLYDEQLADNEIEELEGYLSEKWCVLLTSDSHPYYNDGPDCGECESDCCESEVTTTATSSSDQVEITANYKCSENVFGYQFKLNGLSSLGIVAGLYKSGVVIPSSDSNKKFKVEFTDPLSKAFLNYISVDGSGDVYVVGHFYDGGTGDFEKVFPSTTSFTEFLKITISNHSSRTTAQNFSSISPVLVTSAAKINHPAAPHPVLATYFENEFDKTRTPVTTFNGDSTGDGTVSITDVEEIIKRISLSHAAGAWDLQTTNSVANSWMQTLDANNKGWLDVCDAVTTLLALKSYSGSSGGSGTPISTSATINSSVLASNLLSQPACTSKMQVTECEPCPCPEIAEPEECVSKMWVADVRPIKRAPEFSIVTIKYQSSCCIDGYVIELGGYDVAQIGHSTSHDGVVYAPSIGNDIGQQATESHQRNWLHGTTIDPSYSGDVALENSESLFQWNAASSMGIPAFLARQPEVKVNFPIVWGMSVGNLMTAIASNIDSKNKDKYLSRTGFNCIPATCRGESKILTKFVVNSNSFLSRPFIKKFRLITNDDLKTPASFTGGGSITWTGDGADADSLVGPMDWTESLFYLYTGWSRTTTWASTANTTLYRGLIAPFNAENDDEPVDVVDVLTVANHMLVRGPDTSDPNALVVPSDCCPCPLPGSFTVAGTINPCHCYEENYVRNREGEVTLAWTESANAKQYIIYRLTSDRSESTENRDSNTLSSWWNNRFGGLISNRIGGRAITGAEQFAETYKAYRRSQTNSTWEKIGSTDASTRTFVDVNAPKFEDCCPETKLPRVKYVVVARNDCGEVSADYSYQAKCCNIAPKANDVNLNDQIMNAPTNFMASAYHPFAVNPFGGLESAAKARITFTGVPVDDARIKLINFKNKGYTFVFKAGSVSDTSNVKYIDTTGLSSSSDVATAFKTKFDSIGVSTLLMSSDVVTAATPAGHYIDISQDDGVADKKNEYTLCGNTLITVAGDTSDVITTPARFTGGNRQCVEGWVGFPDECERLTFVIDSVDYSNPTSGIGGVFVGSGDAGGGLPAPNVTGRWQFIPPQNYIGTVTFHYRVINESGCEDRAKITVTYLPAKSKIHCETYPCDDPRYGEVIIKFKIPLGVMGDVKVLRKSSSDTSDWNSSEGSTQVIDTITLAPFSRSEYFKVLDSPPTPDKCCTESISYDYALLICQVNAAVVPSANMTFATIQPVQFCQLSRVCTVVIDCCQGPKNPIPTVTTTDCEDAGHPKVTIKWAGVDEAQNPIGYVVYRREAGSGIFERVSSDIRHLKDVENPNWNNGESKFFYEDADVTSSTYCDYGTGYEYAVIAYNDITVSGNPNDTDWFTHPTDNNFNQGDSCSPGGTTIAVTVPSCPPSPCPEEININICLETDFSIDLSTLVDCIPIKPDGTRPSISYSIHTQESWVGAVVNSEGVLSFDTHGIDFGVVGAGPHMGAIVWRMTISESACPSTTNVNVNITLEDCGCPCPDDEKDYTICDVNYDTAQYVSDGKLINGLEQLPFSFAREGGQTLRKGQPYVVSKGKIDYE